MITASNITSTSVDLSWTVAKDNQSAPTSLEYKVVRSSIVSNIDTVSEADSAVTVTDWTSNLTSTTASSLSSSTSYSFAVLVRDASGNKSLYTPVTAKTLSGGGGDSTYLVTLVKTHLDATCSGGSVQYAVTPFGDQTIKQGETATYTFTRCNGMATPNLTGTNSCGGVITNLGGDVYSYTSNAITADCNVEIN